MPKNIAKRKPKSSERCKRRTRARMGAQARVADMSNQLRRYRRADTWLLASLLTLGFYCDVPKLKSLLREASISVDGRGWWEEIPDDWDPERSWPASKSQERLRAQGAKILRSIIDNQEAL